MTLSTAALMIVFLQALMAIPAGYVITIAPQTGMRQMIQFRYVFGKYGNIITAIINVITVGGYGITGSITGGQCLVRVQDGKLPIEGGIAIVLIIGMVIGFLGYRFIHLIMKWYWIVTLFAVIVLIGCAGDQLHLQAPDSGRPPQSYLGIVALASGNMISWANVVGDFACYMPPSAPKVRIGFYAVAGVTISFSLLMVLGAAIGGAISQIPSWEAAYEVGGMGGVLGEILIERLGNFGRFVLVLLGVSVFGTACRDIYTISISLPAIVPALRHVPRVLLAIVASGVMIAIAIPASQSFVSSISSFLAIVGYYVGASISCFMIEWLYFRRSNAETLNPAIWDNASALPTGIPAVISVLLPWALIVPSMDTAWYTGPIAKVTGDIAFEFSVVLGCLCYIPLRSYEIKRNGGRLNRDGIY
jgi:purine-cytosine permease-like protein